MFGLQGVGRGEGEGREVGVEQLGHVGGEQAGVRARHAGREARLHHVHVVAIDVVVGVAGDGLGGSDHLVLAGGAGG